MDAKELISKVNAVLAPAVESLGYELIEVEYLNEGGRWILRLYIDVNGGQVTLDDCTRVSRAAGSVLDVENIMQSSYNLEVSSPGSERPLRRPQDFVRFSGATVRIRTRSGVDGRRNFTGVLKGCEGGAVALFADGRDVNIPLEEIAKARLQVAHQKIK